MKCAKTRLDPVDLWRRVERKTANGVDVPLDGSRLLEVCVPLGPGGWVLGEGYRAVVQEEQALLAVTEGGLARRGSLAIQQTFQVVPVIATVLEMTEQKDL